METISPNFEWGTWFSYKRFMRYIALEFYVKWRLEEAKANDDYYWFYSGRKHNSHNWHWLLSLTLKTHTIDIAPLMACHNCSICPTSCVYIRSSLSDLNCWMPYDKATIQASMKFSLLLHLGRSRSALTLLLCVQIYIYIYIYIIYVATKAQMNIWIFRLTFVLPLFGY